MSDEPQNAGEVPEVEQVVTPAVPAILAPEIIELARHSLARCPGCKSHDITRQASRSNLEGPMDKCNHCGHTFPHKPGTITAEMHADALSRQDGRGEGAEPEAVGTTDTAGFTETDPPVTNADGTPIEDDEKEGMDDFDQMILDRHELSRGDMPELESDLARREFGQV